MYKINSDYIKSRIKEIGLTHQQVAEKLGISPTSFSILINQEPKNINLQMTYNLSKILDIAIDEIIVDDVPIKIDALYFENKIDQLTKKLNSTIKMYGAYKNTRSLRVQNELNKLKDKSLNVDSVSLNKDDIDLLYNIFERRL